METKERNRRFQTVGHYLEWKLGIHTFHEAECSALTCEGQSAPGWNEETVVSDEWADKMEEVDAALCDLTPNQMVELVEAAMGEDMDEASEIVDDPSKAKRPEFLNEVLSADKADLIWNFVVQLYYGELSEMLNC